MTSECISYNNSPAVKIATLQGSHAIISLYGATLLSWKPAQADEQLYLSERSSFTEGLAIRGGVPICFPQFSTLGNLPQHGFARNQKWDFIASEMAENSVIARFRLVDNAQTRAVWDYAFNIELIVELENNRLSISLQVLNSGTQTFSFTAALHTYFKVNNIHTARILGLKNSYYHDKVAKLEHQLEMRDEIKITQEIDRVYFNTSSPLTLQTPEYHLKIYAKNMPDTIIWNPWQERSVKLADFPDDGFNNMLCIEAAAVGSTIELQPQTIWLASQIIELH